MQFDCLYLAGTPITPAGANTGSDRVYRGGSWESDAGTWRSAYRCYYTPDLQYCDLGFRLTLVGE
ncbi:MAG: hypothetical protein FWE67_11250 [Planctomycetaceae bacterium]|nr:hypothetical protein [Planctomycetaceae bacterium]